MKDAIWGAATLQAPALRLAPGYADDLVAQLPGASYVDSGKFFAKHHEDLLALPYYVPVPRDDGGQDEWYGRLHITAGRVLQAAGLEPLAEWVVADLDPEAPVAWPELPPFADLFQLAEDLGAWCVFSTPKGLRVVWRLEEHVPISRYADAAAYLTPDTVTVAGRVLNGDPSGDQWNRLQRLPHATRWDDKYPDLRGKPLPATVAPAGRTRRLPATLLESVPLRAAREAGEATGKRHEITDEDWKLVYEADLAPFYAGELPPELEGSTYKAFRKAAWLIAQRLVEVGEDVNLDKVGSYLSASWENTDKGDQDYVSMLRGVADDLTVDHMGAWSSLPREAPGEYAEEVKRARTITYRVSERGKLYSPAEPPPQSVDRWVEGWVSKARAYGFSDVSCYFALAGLDPRRRGMDDSSLWSFIQGRQRGTALLKARAKALTMKQAVLEADELAPPPLVEAQRGTYMLDYSSNSYRKMPQGIRSREEALRDYAFYCGQAGKPWVATLVEAYLSPVPRDHPNREAALAEQATARRSLFARTATEAPRIRLVGDTGQGSLGEWVGPSVFRMDDCRSQLDVSIPVEHINAVEDWLGELGGDRAAQVRDWLAVVGATDHPAAALGLVGDKGVGKSLLANAIGTLFGGKAQLSGTSNFQDGMDRYHFLDFDEGMQGMGSDLFRSLVTSYTRTVNIKYAAMTEVMGYTRSLISANDMDKLLPGSTSFSAATGEAVADRILVAVPSPQALRARKALINEVDRRINARGESPSYAARAREVACHLRSVMVAHRARVLEGSKDQLAVTGSGAALLARINARANEAAYSTIEVLLYKVLDGTSNWPMHYRDGRLLVATNSTNGPALLSDEVWRGDTREPVSGRRQRMRSAFGRAVRRRWSGGEKVRVYEVPVSTLAESLDLQLEELLEDLKRLP